MPLRGTGVDSERLRLLGRRASDLYHKGSLSLNDAVTKVVRDEPGLTPEHVRRVIEYANNDAFQTAFSSATGDHRVITFDGGPADPGVVLKELNMGAVTSPVASTSPNVEVDPYIRGADSAGDPFEPVKTASYTDETSITALAATRTRLQGALDHFTSKLSEVGVAFDDAVTGLYKEARQLVLTGHSPATVAIAIQKSASDGDIAKLALKHIQRCMESDRLPEVRHVEKIAGTVNPSHPLVQAFQHFAKVAAQRYTLIAAAEITEQELHRLNARLREYL